MEVQSMPTKRNQTDYTGVFYSVIENDKEFYVQYERNGESIEKMVGLESQGMNAEKAQTLREKIIKDSEMAAKQKQNVRQKMNSVRSVLMGERPDTA